MFIYFFFFLLFQQYLRHVKYILLEVYAFPLPLFLIHIIFQLLIYKNIKTPNESSFSFFLKGSECSISFLLFPSLTIPTIEIAGSVAIIVARIFFFWFRQNINIFFLMLMSQYLRVILLCMTRPLTIHLALLLNSSSL